MSEAFSITIVASSAIVLAALLLASGFLVRAQRARLKVGDIEAEGSTVADVEQLLDMAWKGRQ